MDCERNTGYRSIPEIGYHGNAGFFITSLCIHTQYGIVYTRNNVSIQIYASTTYSVRWYSFSMQTEFLAYLQQ